jgi:hypothetical protein
MQALQMSPILRRALYTLCLVLGLAACDDEPSPASDAGISGDAAVETTGLSISSADARACEIAFTAAPTSTVAVTFNSTVKGSWRRREDRVAVSVITADDAAFAPGSFSVGGVDGIEPTILRCYNRAGQLIPGVTLTAD